MPKTFILSIKAYEFSEISLLNSLKSWIKFTLFLNIKRTSYIYTLSFIFWVRIVWRNWQSKNLLLLGSIRVEIFPRWPMWLTLSIHTQHKRCRTSLTFYKSVVLLWVSLFSLFQWQNSLGEYKCVLKWLTRLFTGS